MPAARFYSSTSGAMDLSASITSADTSITVSTTTGLPGTTPFTLVLDPGTASEEIVDVTNVSGTTLTVTRGMDGSSAQAHSAGVGNVRHMATARDFREPQEHIGSSAGVHGVTGSVVGTDGTQTLKNKTAQASAATAVALTVKATTGQTANVLEVQDAGNVARFTVDKDGVANSVPAAATTGIKVTQSGSPTAPGVHILSDKFLGSDDYIKLQPGQANVIDYAQGDYLLTTPASVKVGKSGRITVTGSAGLGEPTTPLLTLVNSDTSTPTTLSIKNSAGTEVAKVDKDGNLTSPTITSLQSADTSLGNRVTAIEGNLGSQTTFAATSAARDGKRLHWDLYTTAATDASGYVTVTHNAGFTPRAVKVSAADTAYASNHADATLTCDSFTATTFRLRATKPSGVVTGQAYTISAILGE